MGIESDQLVYDYLSRVGDLAQQRQLTSGDRMRLVADLRLRIDRDRAGATADTPAAVRRILARLGTPEDVVDAAGGPPGPTTPSPPPAPRPSTPHPAVPTQRGPRPRRKPAPNPPRQTPEAEARDTDGATGSGGTGGAGSGSLRGDSGRNAGSGAGGGGRRGLDGDGGRNAGAGGRGGLDGDGRRDPGGGEGGGGEAVKGLRRLVPRPRRAPKAPTLEGLEGLAGLGGLDGSRPSPPHLAGSHELGPSGSEPDWWRLDSSPFGLADSVPGFVGGVEIPEILKPPPAPDDPVRPAKDGSAKGDAVDGPLDVDEFGEDDEAEGRRWWRPRLGGGEGVRFANPLLLCAAALLLVGAVLGSLPALGGGWLIAYLSRRLTRAEAKWAVFGMPGLAVAAGLAWLWGRTDGRWGEPVREGHMSDAIAGTWPWVVRGAAVASALFLVWRSQRRRL
ncbi:hypothetical protein [Streptomyces sp. NPDC023327]|uniref:hypothetical protein n=1 Tax=Streptomyces sp. NPDC023327 TaxID=3157088 RepID=UPI00340B6B2A